MYKKIDAFQSCLLIRITWGADSFALAWGQEICALRAFQVIPKTRQIGKYYSNPSCKF